MSSVSGSARGSFDHRAGVWLVPVSDAWLDMLRGDWSLPVQLRAITADDGKTYTMRVRRPDGPDLIAAVAHAVELDMHAIKSLPPGSRRETEIRLAVERAFTAATR